MSDSQIGFLPWMQRGLINYSSEVQDMIAPPNERAKILVKLTSNTGYSVTKDFKLVGPGDITGVDPSMIIRTDPANGFSSFSDNLMAYLEFADVDFPWQFTPAKPNAPNNQHLNSWLALVVLKDSEYTIAEPLSPGLPKRLVINPGGLFGQYFHPQNEHWAWAHVQVNNPVIPSSGTVLSAFQGQLLSDPTAGISRLICPRKLAPNTQYTAFLIPFYETGRLAGLGRTDLTAIGSQQASWNIGSTITGTTGIAFATDPNQFPIYYSWRFGTAAQGDFETLARAMVPRAIDPGLGGVKMDISNSGMGLNSLFVSPPPGTVSTVLMEGALAPQTFVPAPMQDVSSAGASGLPLFTNKLLNLLNLGANLASDDAATVAALASAPPVNPYVPGTTYANDDPVVLPPIYGQWHAYVNKLSTSAPAWVQQLNLDVRYRAAAGLGSKVVKENQEYFIASAWEQVGEVLRVNDRMAKGKFAATISSQMHRKHFVADTRVVSSTSTVNASMNHIAHLGSRFLRKINNSAASPYGSIAMAAPTSGGTTFLASSFNDYTLKNVLSRSLATKGATNSGFKKMVRNRSHAVSKMALVTANKTLVSAIADNTSNVKAAPLKIIPPERLLLASTLTATSTSMASGSSMVAYVSTIYLKSYEEFQTMLSGYDSLEAAQPKNEHVAIDAARLTKTVIASVDPQVTVTRRILDQINLQYNGVTHILNGLNDKIMAYPVMDDSMYQYLIKMSTEYLLPNLAQYPNNTVALLQNNNRFIEAFMAGLNHEFAKELLWRGYPTDQRGSYFRRFWDTTDTVNTAPAYPSYMYDINRMHKWNSVLGGNNTDTRFATLTFPTNFLVLLIRADLLKKYPNALIYAQRAKWASTAIPAIVPTPPPHSHVLDENAITGGTYNHGNLKFPIFKAQLDPDIILLGFDLDAAQAKGDAIESAPGVGNPGWFFVFRERPGQISFGMDAPPVPSTLATWNDMNWGHMKSVVGGVPTDLPTARLGGLIGDVPLFSGTTGAGGLRWNANAGPAPSSPPSDSAQVASILFQDPVQMAIHGRSLLL